MLYVARGVALLISDGRPIPNLGRQAGTRQHGFGFLGGGRPLGLPIVDLDDDRARAGRRLSARLRRRSAAGSTPSAATSGRRELSGVPVRTGQDVRLHVLRLLRRDRRPDHLLRADSAAPPAGREASSSTPSPRSSSAAPSLSGGAATSRGTLVGAFVIGFLADGLVIIGVSTFWQIVIKGAVIILAVVLDQGQQRFQRKGAAVAATVEAEHAARAAARRLSGAVVRRRHTHFRPEPRPRRKTAPPPHTGETHPRQEVTQCSTTSHEAPACGSRRSPRREPWR